MIMLGEECQICFSNEARKKLPSCSHATCYSCWAKIKQYEEKPTCPFCRRRQESEEYFEWFRKMPWFIQGLVIFAVYKIVIEC